GGHGRNSRGARRHPGPPTSGMTARTPEALDAPPSHHGAGFVVREGYTRRVLLEARRVAMATMIDGESYVGRVLMRPLSQSGDLRLYCWPLRCLKSHMGGPTFGIAAKEEEIRRFDAHGPRGHW